MKVITLPLALVALVANAQLPHGGSPVNWGQADPHQSAIPVVDLGGLDRAAAEVAADTAGAPGGYRFGVQRTVNADLMTQGAWTPNADGGRTCRLTVRSAGALMMSVQFSTFQLPWGGRLFLYNGDRNAYLGGFTQANEQATGDFATAFLPGDALTIEYQEPAGAPPAHIRIASITHAWQSILPPQAASARDLNPPYPSEPCHNNVVCPIAADWQDQVRSVLWFMMPDGRGCNGTLLNNTLQDGTPYVLIANHCYQPTESQWVFYFNFQSPTCIGDTGQTAQTLTGSVRRAVLYHGDFCLMELNDLPPASFGVYYAGWDHSGNPPQSGAGILDPRADVKKISFYNQPATTVLVDVEQIPCWQNYWFNGILEAGASGAPMFDQNKRVVGHYIDGVQTCETATTDPSYASKFSENWDGGTGLASRLRDWLDPADTAMFLDGYDPNGTPPAVVVKAKVMLQGPFVQGSGLMSAGLNNADLVPLSEPYTALGYTFPGGGGGEATAQAVLDVTGQERVVDWVVVELRNKNNAAQVMAARAALLRRDGSIVDIDGVSDVLFTGMAADDYYVAVRHRNHLGIITATAKPLSASASLIDFTDTSVAVMGGANAAKMIGSTRCLIAGDGNHDGVVRYTGAANDRDAILVRIGGINPTDVYQGYVTEDVNMDGQVMYSGAGNDRDFILTNIGSQPTTVLSGGLP